MNVAKRLLVYVGIYFVFCFVCIGTLWGVFSLPSQQIKINAKEGHDIILEDEHIAEENTQRMFGYYYFIDNDWTDILMMEMNYLSDEKDALYYAFYCPVPLQLWESQPGSIFDLALPDGDITQYSYGRYWHGYNILLRPMLLVFNYRTIHIVLCILFVLLNALIIFLLCKKISWKVGLSFFIATQLLLLYSAFVSLTYMLSFMPGYIGGILLLLFFKDEKFVKWLPFFFFMVGSFEIFWTFPEFVLNTFGMCFVIAYIIIKKQKYNANLYKLLAFTLAAFIVGEGLTWGVKWILADLIFNFGLISHGFYNFYLRIIGNGTGHWMRTTISMAVSNIFIIISLVPIFVVFMLIIFLQRKIGKNLPLVISFCFPFIFVSVLAAFSRAHIFFYVYKCMFYAVFGCLYLIFEKRKETILLHDT